jgi:hypothetical protein
VGEADIAICGGGGYDRGGAFLMDLSCKGRA